MFSRQSLSVSAVVCIWWTLCLGSAAAELPTPIYETTLPGYTIPHARDVVVDDAGNAYLIGSAYDD